MINPILLGSTLTDDEFKHLHNLAGYLKCDNKDNSYFWILSDLSIGCSNLRMYQDFTYIVLKEEFLSYIEQQKLLRTLE